MKSIIRKKDTSKMILGRCQILVDLDESHGDILIHEQSVKSNDVCLATFANTVTKYMSGGIQAVTEYKRSIHSDNARRKVDGRAQARIIELACGPAPDGHINIIRRALKNRLRPHRSDYWCIPPKEDAEFVACMDVLDCSSCRIIERNCYE